LLNITPDHLDRHGSIEAYAAIKEQLVAHVGAGGTAIVGVDDVYCAAIADRLEAAGKRVLRVSVEHILANGIYRDGTRLMLAQSGTARMVADLAGIGALKGIHNAQNAAAAYGALAACGVADEVIQAGLRSFPGLAHRMERIGTCGNVLFVNDSKATNADAADKALSSYDNIYWIAGGVAKAGGIEPLRDYFPMLRKAYLIGAAAQEFAASIGTACPSQICGTLDAAVDAAFADAAASGDAEPVVLLSPACASYDQYRNFEIRGDAFRAKVRGLPSFRPSGGEG
jgi:UDP-N-acetylmuramoylalanine--D-glutamate ligase